MFTGLLIVDKPRKTHIHADGKFNLLPVCLSQQGTLAICLILYKSKEKAWKT